MYYKRVNVGRIQSHLRGWQVNDAAFFQRSLAIGYYCFYCNPKRTTQQIVKRLRIYYMPLMPGDRPSETRCVAKQRWTAGQQQKFSLTESPEFPSGASSPDPTEWRLQLQTLWSAPNQNLGSTASFNRKPKIHTSLEHSASRQHYTWRMWQTGQLLEAYRAVDSADPPSHRPITVIIDRVFRVCFDPPFRSFGALRH